MNERCVPPRARLCPSMTQVATRYLYVIGGMSPTNLENVLPNVDCYDVESDSWPESRRSCLQEARYWHSSCTLDSAVLYTFCGYGLEGKRLESIERFRHPQSEEQKDIASE